MNLGMLSIGLWEWAWSADMKRSTGNSMRAGVKYCTRHPAEHISEMNIFSKRDGLYFTRRGKNRNIALGLL